MNIANAAFHALKQAVAQEPSLEEILSGLRNDLEDAEARLYCANMHSDFGRWTTERDRWQQRVIALRRHIQIVEGL